MQIKMKEVHKVTITEYERGWGSKVDEILYFTEKQEALDYVQKYNSKNTASSAPDWYMQAEYSGRIS